MKAKSNRKKFSRKQFMKNAGGVILGGGLVSSMGVPLIEGVQANPRETPLYSPDLSMQTIVKHIAADPTVLPSPITRQHSETVRVELEAKEVVAEIEEGVKFHYMTFGGQVPSPMIRVRQGDTVILTLSSDRNNQMLHNIDLHAVYGTGGGADATYVTPGSSQTIKFKALYPGAFIYHCAVPRMDQHISSGMYGIILVEPQEGLPEVDHEFYLGQNEIYVKGNVGEHGMQEFDFNKMYREDADYVLLNGEVGALKKEGVYGPMKVKKGETARIFFVNGGPNLSSSFHPIGNVFTKAWRDGAIASNPEHFVQTMAVPPGSCGVFEMDFPVPSTVHMVDHALSRVEDKGFGGDIEVEGKEDKDIFDPFYEE